jgi:dihydroorotate dehydrogenase electron transfer subunit
MTSTAMPSSTRSFGSGRVLDVREVARDTVILGVEVPWNGPVRPGQFAMVHLGDDHEYVLPRPYSILDVHDGRMDLLVKIAGRGSRALTRVRAGDTVRVFGPLGRWFDAPLLRERPAILVAGGVGVVPLHLLARELKAGEGPRPLPIFGARTPLDLPMTILGDEPAGPWQLWVEEDPHEGMRRGRVTEGLLEALDTTVDAVVATCGPTPMMHAVARICGERGVPLWVCLEEQMGCGAGVCRACVIEDAREPRMRTVCKEGPVFAVEEIRFVPEDPSGATAGGCAP